MIDLKKIESLLTDVNVMDSQGNEGQRLNEVEVYQICDSMNFTRCAAEFLPKDSNSEETNTWAKKAIELAGPQGRILLKIVGRKILHKTEVGGVKILDVKADSQVSNIVTEVKELYKSLQASGNLDLCEGVMAGEFVPHKANCPGQEVLLSLRQDPAFGPVVVLGIGGTLTEWFGKGNKGGSSVIFPAKNLQPQTVKKVLEVHPILSLLCMPSRLYKEAPIGVENLVNAVMGLAALGVHFGPAGDSEYTLEEIEINPAVASLGRLVALDGVGLVSKRKWALASRPIQKINPLLAPKSAVVMGVSAKSANPGRIILDNLLRSPGIDQKRLYVVHHKESEILGVPCFASTKKLPEKCDLAVVSIPAQGALEAIKDLVATDRAESIILIPGGFAEAGETDLAEAIEEELISGHRGPGGGPVLVGGNCLGIVSRDNYNTFFLPQYKLPFKPGQGENLAVVSQSGAYLVTFASNYDGMIHPRASISFGNQMDLTVSDFVAHFNEVPEVNVIACYVEGFRPGDGDSFLHHSRRSLELGKKVIIFKAGKTALGAQAAASHTASLAGDYAVAKSCLESAGITVAESLDEFEDLIKTFTLLADKKAGGLRTGIISNAGFECSTVMDQLDTLELATFDNQTQAVLDGILPGFAHRSNPIDCTPMTGTEAFCASCDALLNSDSVDLAILSSVPVTPALNNLPADSSGIHREDMSKPDSQPSLMIKIINASAKPAVVVVDSGDIYNPMCRMIEQAGVPVFRKIDRAARALAAFCKSQEVVA